MEKKHEADNNISFDIDLDEVTSDPVSISLEVDTEESVTRRKNTRIKRATSFIGSKAKAIKEADIFKPIDTLQDENPSYLFLCYTNENFSKNRKRMGDKFIWMPYRRYSFYSNNSNINYSAETAEQKIQDIIIKLNNHSISEIREINPASFAIFVKDSRLSNLERIRREKGWNIFRCGNVEIRERWTGYLEINTLNGVQVASVIKSGIRQVLKCSREVDLTTVITIIIAVNAYHNVKKRLSNPDAPYEVYYHDTRGGGGE